MQTNTESATPIVAEIGRTLGYPPEAIPTQIDEKKTAEVLGVKVSTLTNWRTTGRYALPYIKVGRLVRYRVADLAARINQLATLMRIDDLEQRTAALERILKAEVKR